MIARWRIVAKQRRRFILIHNQNVEVAVVVEVAERATPAHVALIERGLRAIRYFFKCSVSPVTEDNSRSFARVLGENRFKLRVDLPSDNENIWVAVVVEIEQARAPAYKAPLADEPSLRGDIFEFAFTKVMVKTRGLVHVVGTDDV